MTSKEGVKTQTGQKSGNRICSHISTMKPMGQPITIRVIYFLTGFLVQSLTNNGIWWCGDSKNMSSIEGFSTRSLRTGPDCKVLVPYVEVLSPDGEILAIEW